MRIEHTGYNVEDPTKAAAWYAQNLGFKIVRAGGPPSHAQFLADDTGGVMIEIYNNPACDIPDYRNQNPLVLHLALVSRDIAADVARLTDAGASVAEPLRQTPDGDRLCMLRDPWGFAIQLVSRARPMIR